MKNISKTFLMHIRKNFNNSLPPRGKYATIKFYRHIRERIFLRDRKLSRASFMICYRGVIKENEGDIFMCNLQRWKCRRRKSKKVLRPLSLSCKSVMQINKFVYLIGVRDWNKSLLFHIPLCFKTHLRGNFSLLP